MKEGDFRIIMTAIICLMLLEGWALYLGYNGSIQRIVVIVIAGLAGLMIKSPVELKGGK